MACTCGHAIEEHGRDLKFPGSMACRECDCICYEEDPADDDADGDEDFHNSSLGEQRNG